MKLRNKLRLLLLAKAVWDQLDDKTKKDLTKKAKEAAKNVSNGSKSR